MGKQDHTLYVADLGDGRVEVVSARDRSHVGDLVTPVGVKIHAATNGRSLLFVCDHGNKRMEQFDV